MALAAQVSTSSTAPNSRRPRPSAEAARYSVLRRLAPALKHDMVVNLQAVAMMAEVLNARLERGLSNPNELQKSVSKINRLAREAVMTCLDVAGWIEPGEDAGIRLPEGVAECVMLLAGNFNFRGFSIANEVPDIDFEVSREALRNLLSAALITLTDTATAPAELLVKAEVSAGFAILTIRCEAREIPRCPALCRKLPAARLVRRPGAGGGRVGGTVPYGRADRDAHPTLGRDHAAANRPGLSFRAPTRL